MCITFPRGFGGGRRPQGAAPRHRPACAPSAAASRLAVALGFVLVAIVSNSAAAQGPSPLLPLMAATAQGQALVMPVNAAPGTLVAGGLQVEVSVDNGLRTYRVWHRGRLHTAHASLQGPTRRFAFDLHRERFDEVAQTLLLRLKAEEDLAGLIAETGALGGKSYPALGWALLRLPEAANPAEVALRLEAEGLVTAAEVQLKGAVYVPF